MSTSARATLQSTDRNNCIARAALQLIFRGLAVDKFILRNKALSCSLIPASHGRFLTEELPDERFAGPPTFANRGGQFLDRNVPVDPYPVRLDLCRVGYMSTRGTGTAKISYGYQVPGTM